MFMENKYVDFTNCPTKNKTYGGANGSKLSVIYDGKTYMLKMPVKPAKKSKALIYE